MFLSCFVAGLLFPPFQISTVASAAFHFSLAGAVRAGLLPGKRLGELNAAAQPSPASFSLSHSIPLPNSMHPDRAAELL